MMKKMTQHITSTKKLSNTSASSSLKSPN